MRGNGGRKFLGQVKIAADAPLVWTIEAEHGSGVGEVWHVADLAVLRDTFGVEKAEVDGQRLQVSVFFGEAGRVFRPLAFLLAVF